MSFYFGPRLLIMNFVFHSSSLDLKSISPSFSPSPSSIGSYLFLTSEGIHSFPIPASPASPETIFADVLGRSERALLGLPGPQEQLVAVGGLFDVRVIIIEHQSWS